MSATANFANRWRRSGRSAAVLVQIDLVAAAEPAVTIYASHDRVSTPNGVWWEPLLQDSLPINAPGGLGTADIPLCTARVALNLKKVSSQTGSVLGLLHGRSVVGSTVTIYLWETGLTSWADVLQVFKGTVQDYTAAIEGLVLNLRQRTDWNRPVCPALDPSIYPRAPEGGRGAPLPIVYGKVVGPGLRQPHAPAHSLAQRRLEMLRGPRGLSRGALVDHGRGGASKPKVLAAAHKVTSLFDPGTGAAIWLDIGGKMVFVNASPGDVVNTTSESGIFIVDDQPALVMADLGDLRPGVVDPARNPRYCLEPSDVTFAELDYNALARDLQITMGSMAALGQLDRAEVVCVYEANIGTNLFLQASRDDGGGVLQVALGATTAPTLATTGSLPIGAEPFMKTWGDFSHYVARVYYGGVATGSYVKVYFLGLLATFFLRRKVVVADHQTSRAAVRPTFRKTPGFSWNPYAEYDSVPETTELAGDYYWNVHGIGDGTPLVAGVIDALLEQAPHLYAHILGRFGGQPLGAKVEDAPTVFGSYTEAVADFKTWTTRIMPFGLTVAETTDVMTVLSWLAASSLSFIYLDRFSDKFHIVPWRTDRAVNWVFTFTPRELNETPPECRMTPDSSIATGIRLRYGWNGKNGSFDDEAAVAANHSNAGQKYIGLRDENLTVVASLNDRINFVSAGGTFVVTLTPAGYAPGALAQHAQTLMNAADPSGTREYYCAYGGVVTLGHNDGIYFSDGSIKQAFIPAGTYTMEALAVAVAAAMNAAASSGWSCTYSRTTGKFTISRSSGTAQLQFEATAGLARSAAVLLGFRPVVRTGSLSYEGDVFIEEQRFAFGLASSTIDLRWATGADGSEAATPRTAASLFGFDSRFDYGKTTLQIHVAPCPKSNREATVAATEALYGKRREGTYEARCIYDGEVAREIRNRLMDLYGKPRLRVEFTTEHAPDLERGRVIAFSSDFDAVLPYPEPGTDGSWSGKRFVVVETEQLLGPASYSTRVIAVSL